MTALASSARLYEGNREPALSQMLADPIVLCLMTSDGVEMTELLALLIQTSAQWMPDVAVDQSLQNLQRHPP